MKAIDRSEKYSFTVTNHAVEIGSRAVIGGDLRSSIVVDLETLPVPVSDALDALDGTRTIEEISDSSLQGEHRAVFENVLRSFLEHGVIERTDEKTRAIASSSQSGIDYRRYDRQINLFRSCLSSYGDAIKVQEALAKAKVSLVGLGGCGSYIFYTLSAMGIGGLRCYEFDTVDISNLSRQILYSHDDIGKKKIAVAQARSKSISPSTHFEFFDKKIETIDDAIDAWGQSDLLISAADMPRPDFFFMMNEAAFKARKPLLYVGSYTTNAAIGPLLVPGTTRCLQCIDGKAHRRTGQARHRFVDRIAENYMTTLIDPYNATAGSLGALEAVKFLTGFDKLQVLGTGLTMSFSDYTVRRDVAEQAGHCAICG